MVHVWKFSFLSPCFKSRTHLNIFAQIQRINIFARIFREQSKNVWRIIIQIRCILLIFPIVTKILNIFAEHFVFAISFDETIGFTSTNFIVKVNPNSIKYKIKISRVVCLSESETAIIVDCTMFLIFLYKFQNKLVF